MGYLYFDFLVLPFFVPFSLLFSTSFTFVIVSWFSYFCILV